MSVSLVLEDLKIGQYSGIWTPHNLKQLFLVQQMLSIAIFLLFQTINTRAESLQAFFKTEHNSVLFDETPISEKRSDSLISCSHRCTRDKRCKSANFVKSDKTCSLLDKTRATHPGRFLKQANVIHLEKVFYT